MALFYWRRFLPLFLILLSVYVSRTLAGRQHGRGRHGAPDIKAEEPPRKAPRAAECQFGNQVKELGSTWFADLGPPFGVMYCIRCQCVPVQKKRRVVGRVHCKNIKNECPKPTCDEPVLLPGRCCKVCSGDLNSPDVIQDVSPAMTPEEEEKNQKYFAALLTARTSSRFDGLLHSGSNGNSGGTAESEIAGGRFNFHRRNLYYSFFSSSRPKNIQFLDTKGNILEEQPLGPANDYQNKTGKICGVWRRIPREYRRMIREERLIVSLIWENEKSINGQLFRYRSLATETYSALLEGGQPGSGGTAIVSVSTVNPSIHVTVVFNGLFSSEETSNIPLSLKLYSHEKQAVVMEEIIRVAKPSWELNNIEASVAVSAAELRMLTRGKLMLTLSSRSDSSLLISGRVVTRTSCDLYQALVLPPVSSMPPPSPIQAEGESKKNEQATLLPAGTAWLYVDLDGGIRFNLKFQGIPEPYVVTLVVEKRGVELEELTPWLRGGVGEGILERVSPRHLEQLYSGDLGIGVSWGSSSTARGRLFQRPAVPPRAASSKARDNHPALLFGSKGVAMGWIAVDPDCNLQYEVVASSGVGGSSISDGSTDRELWLSETPLEAEGAPVRRRLLETFSGQLLEGSNLAQSQLDLTRLNAGLARLELIDPSSPDFILKSQWLKVEVPPSCLPDHAEENELQTIGGGGLGSYLRDAGDVPIGLERGGSGGGGPCYHGGKFHEDGSQWRGGGHCSVCHCSNGKVNCDPVVCPPIPPGCHSTNCCHSCYNLTEEILNSSGKSGCSMAGQFFPRGSTWHPYLPPNGFDTCVVCTCNALTLKVSCPRVSCPKLNCNEKSAIWPTLGKDNEGKRPCCKVCSSTNSSSMAYPTHHFTHVRGKHRKGSVSGEGGMAGDQGSPKTEAEILADGGCKYPVSGPYPNGHEWHPRLYSHGEYKCVKCRCKDGRVKCERKRCTKWSCSDECCKAQCGGRTRRDVTTLEIWQRPPDE